MTTASRIVPIVLFGLALVRSVSAGSSQAEEVDRLAGRGPSNDVVQRLAEFDDRRLVEALYTSERIDVILEALVAKGDNSSTNALLDFLQWQLTNTNDPMGAGLTVRALWRRGDRRAGARLYDLLMDRSRPDQLRLYFARAVHRVGEPHQVAEAHEFLLTLYSSDYERRHEFDLASLIEALGEIGDEGQRALAEWLLAGTGFFAHSLQIMGQLLAEPTPVALDTLLRYAETLDYEPLVQVELLEHLLAADEDLDIVKAYDVASSMTDQYATRRDALIWRLRKRLDGHLIEIEPTLKDVDLERAIVAVTDRLLQEYLELEGWGIPELWPSYIESQRKKNAAGEPGIADSLLQESPPQVLDLLLCCAERLRFAPEVRESLLEMLRATELTLGIPVCGPESG